MVTGPIRQPIREPIRHLDAPITIAIKGKDRLFSSHDSVLMALRELELKEISLNHQAARAAFHLGRALIDCAKALGYGHLSHLYNEAGINGRRAGRAIRFAKFYSDADGGFDFDKYKAGELVARNRHETGESPCTFDTAGSPSLLAVQRAEGLHPDSKPKNAGLDTSVGTKDRTNTQAFDPMGALVALGDRHRQGDQRHRRDACATGNWAAGEQMMIDFDLAATERKLASAIGEAELAYLNGSMSQEQAIEINNEMEALARRVVKITQEYQHNRS